MAMAGKASLPPAAARRHSPPLAASPADGRRFSRHCWMTHHSASKKRWFTASTTSRCRPTRCCCRVALMRPVLRRAPGRGRGASGPAGAWPPRWICPTAGGARSQRGAIAAVAEAARNPVASAPRPLLSRTPQFSFHRKTAHRLTGQLAMACGVSPRPARPGLRRSRRQCLPLQRNAPGPDGAASSRNPSPPPVGHGGVWFTTHPGWTALPGEQAGDTIWCWRDRWKTARTNQAKQAFRIDSAAGSSTRARSNGRVNRAAPPHRSGPGVPRAPCCAKRSARACCASATTLQRRGLAVAAAECCIAFGPGPSWPLPTGGLPPGSAPVRRRRCPGAG